MFRFALLVMLASAVQLGAGTHYVIVAGLGGEEEFAQRFESQAREIEKLLRPAPGAQVQSLYGPAATKAKVEAALRTVASSAQKDDSVVLALLGHGSFDGSDYKIALPGPDITAAELAALLDRIPASRQLVVNMTSASGASLRSFGRAGRVVVTATKSGTERNATVFARYWTEALRDPAADADKNETVSALEAFRYAEQKTAQFYETQKRLATEHALLEDTGKGEGVRQPSPQNGRGLAASQFALLRIGAESSYNDPAKQALLKQREELEARIDKLKFEKAALAADDYRRQLRTLLTELARVQAELDQ